MSVLSAPIVVVDSSLGGLSVAVALCERLPHERVVFFADLARGPYHVRSPESVERCVRQILRYARGMHPKHVVLACDVASSVFAPMPPGMTGIIEPGARAVIEAAGSIEKPILGALTSSAAIERRTLERAVMKRRTRARLHMRAAPTLAMLAEEGRDDDDALLIIACEQAIEPLLSRDVEALLIGTAAIAPMRHRIAALAGDHVRVVDASRAVADDVARRLMRSQLLRPGPIDSSAVLGAQLMPNFSWYLTDESPAIFDRAEFLAGRELPMPRIVPVEHLEMQDEGLRLRETG